MLVSNSCVVPISRTYSVPPHSCIGEREWASGQLGGWVGQWVREWVSERVSEWMSEWASDWQWKEGDRLGTGLGEEGSEGSRERKHTDLHCWIPSEWSPLRVAAGRREMGTTQLLLTNILCSSLPAILGYWINELVKVRVLYLRF